MKFTVDIKQLLPMMLTIGALLESNTGASYGRAGTWELGHFYGLMIEFPPLDSAQPAKQKTQSFGFSRSLGGVVPS